MVESRLRHAGDCPGRTRCHEFDLAALARHFPTGDPRVVDDGGDTYLEATALNGLMGDGGQLFAVANDLLTRLNGHTRLDDAGYRPVKLVSRFVDPLIATQHVFVTNEARARDHVVAFASTAEIRAGALVAGVEVDGVP